VQTTCPKRDKTLIALFVSIYTFEVFFENVPIWQLCAGNFTPGQYQHSQPFCRLDISFRAIGARESKADCILRTGLKKGQVK
jgi:hypothetical protein